MAPALLGTREMRVLRTTPGTTTSEGRLVGSTSPAKALDEMDARSPEMPLDGTVMPFGREVSG